MHVEYPSASLLDNRAVIFKFPYLFPFRVPTAKNNSPSQDGRFFRGFSPSAFQMPCYSFQATRWKVVFKEKKRVGEKLLEPTRNH